MRRTSFSRLRAGIPLALAAGLALTASACMTPVAKNSGAVGGAGERAAGAGPEYRSRAEGDQAKRKKPWWRLSQYSRSTGLKPIEPDAMQPGRGLFSGKDGEFVLYRKGEADSSDPTKPSKVRR